MIYYIQSSKNENKMFLFLINKTTTTTTIQKSVDYILKYQSAYKLQIN